MAIPALSDITKYSVSAFAPSVALTTVSLDMGRAGINEKTFNVVDALISPTTALMVDEGSYALTEENQRGYIRISWVCKTGSIDFTIEAIEREVAGVFKVSYMIGA